jgi:hypothetical protein
VRAGAWLLAALAGAALLFEVAATSASEPDAVTCKDDGTTCLVDGRWTDSSGNVWLPDRQVWWDGIDAYWRGQWVTGEGWLHPKYYPDAYPRPAPAGGDIVALISQYPWPVEQALSVARCESGLNPMARNPSGATGLFQIIGGNDAMFDPATNIAAAYRKYLDGVSRGNPWMHWNLWGGCGHFY